MPWLPILEIVQVSQESGEQDCTSMDDGSLYQELVCPTGECKIVTRSDDAGHSRRFSGDCGLLMSFDRLKESYCI